MLRGELCVFFFSSRRRHTRLTCDWSSDVCSSDLDILVNNAGLYASLAMRPFEQIPLEEWRQVMDVNVASMFLTSRAVVPVMRAARSEERRVGKECRSGWAA